MLYPNPDHKNRMLSPQGSKSSRIDATREDSGAVHDIVDHNPNDPPEA
jgi:hypothetical protein